jgi:hypothetical protein
MKPLDEIVALLDDVKVIAHDTTIEFKDAQHILDDERMNDALKIIRGYSWFLCSYRRAFEDTKAS